MNAKPLQTYFVCALCRMETDSGFLVKIRGRQQAICKNCFNKRYGGKDDSENKKAAFPGK